MVDVNSAQLNLTNEQLNTAMKDPKHLRQWILSTDRRHAVIDLVDMVDALPWPGGVEAFMQCMTAYAQYRATDGSGYVEDMLVPVVDMKGMPTAAVLEKRPSTKPGYESITVVVPKGELLEPHEIDEAILALQRLKNRQLEHHKKLKHREA